MTGSHTIKECLNQPYLKNIIERFEKLSSIDGQAMDNSDKVKRW